MRIKNGMMRRDSSIQKSYSRTFTIAIQPSHDKNEVSMARLPVSMNRKSVKLRQAPSSSVRFRLTKMRQLAPPSNLSNTELSNSELSNSKLSNSDLNNAA